MEKYLSMEVVDDVYILKAQKEGVVYCDKENILFPNGTIWSMPVEFEGALKEWKINNDPESAPVKLEQPPTFGEDFILDVIATTLKPELRAKS